VRRFARGAAASGVVTMLGVALQTAGPLASASCDGQECNPHFGVEYGCALPEAGHSTTCCDQSNAHMLDPNHWETTAQNATWLHFESFETLKLHFGAWTGTRVPDISLSSVYIGVDPAAGPDAPYPDSDTPDAAVDNTTLATGNLAEWPYVGAGLVEVENATCSPATVRVVIGFPEVDGGVIAPEYKGPCWPF
jgi:hypothetical protein